MPKGGMPPDDEEKENKKVSDNSALSTQILARWSQLEGDRTYWMGQWQRLADKIMPRRSSILNNTTTPTGAKESALFDTTAMRANQMNASGSASYITGANTRWFSYDPPSNLEDADGVSEYFGQVTEIVYEILAASNFYTGIHEQYLDRSCFGTSALFCEPGDTTPIVFYTFDVGTFAISKNHEGQIDTLFRKVTMSVRNLVEKFGIDNVSESTRNAYNNLTGKQLDNKLDVLHAIFPRKDDDRDPGKKDGANKVIASVWMEMAAKHIVRNSGYDEQPFFCSRYYTWQDSPYGYSPGWMSLPDIIQCNQIQRNLDAIAELLAFPRVLVPDNMEGAVNLGAAGITYFNPTDSAAIPREWATVGRTEGMLERLKEKQDAINDAFMVPLFSMFSQQEANSPNRMTATEVRAREAEKLLAFSPAFSRLTSELLTPLLKRVYGICIRQGLFPELPQALMQQAPDGTLISPDPKIQYSSRLALAVKTMEVSAVDSSLQRTQQLLQITQDFGVTDNLDTDKIIRDSALAEGLDPEFLRSTDEMAQMRQQRQQAQQAQAQQQMQEHLANSAAKMGSVKQDSVLGQQAMQQQ